MSHIPEIPFLVLFIFLNFVARASHTFHEKCSGVDVGRAQRVLNQEEWCCVGSQS